jgi:hypothetical protein
MGKNYSKLKKDLRGLKLATVCEEARCGGSVLLSTLPHSALIWLVRSQDFTCFSIEHAA